MGAAFSFEGGTQYLRGHPPPLISAQARYSEFCLGLLNIACLFTVSIGSALWVGVFILFSTAEELTDMDCLVLVLVALYTILLLLEKADIILLLEVYIEQVISRSSLFFSNNQSCIGESVLLEICSL